MVSAFHGLVSVSFFPQPWVEACRGSLTRREVEALAGLHYVSDSRHCGVFVFFGEFAMALKDDGTYFGAS